MKNSALVVIDLQNDITKNYKEIIENVNRAIDWAIQHRIPRVEAGAQGEHKLARGYMPSQTHSLHWVADEGFHDAIADYLTREAEAVSDEIAALTEMGPFRRGPLAG